MDKGSSSTAALFWDQLREVCGAAEWAEGEKLSWELCLPGDTLQLINCIGEEGVAGWLCAQPGSKCVRLLSLEIIW